MKLKKIVKEMFEIATSLFIGVIALTNFVLFTVSILLVLSISNITKILSTLLIKY